MRNLGGPQKASGLMLLIRKNIFVKHCTVHANTTAKWNDVFDFVIKRMKLTWPPYLNFEVAVMTAAKRANSSSILLELLF